ncbi:hypothetical protein AMS68_003082 [Peltaster fructicola]|uniref:Exportin-T n=1 Tax=Peltaster fructicola TaxID=286661 RepID=A0A6H0XSE6_9PEZI|nr:hypothetical protein AMS68_003082 [Peltaster fructicola]
MEQQVENAIELAFSPTTDQNLKVQAYDFLNQVRQDLDGWRVSLALFARQPPPSEVVRLVSLEVVNNAVQTRNLAQQDLVHTKTLCMDYVRQHYTGAGQLRDNASIQNKLAQTLTYLFIQLYDTQWPGFFDELKAVCGSEQEIGISHPVATAFFLRILGSVHDEIADVLIPRSQEEHKRSTELKDLVRVRDANKIAVTWQEILSRWRQIDLSLVEMCLRTVAKWVSWIDIWLVVNESIQTALLDLAGQQGSFDADSKEAKVRDAAIDTFTETVAKKMAPNDKIGLIRGLNLGAIVGQLVTSSGLAATKGTSVYDTDLAETVAKLVNNIVLDIVRILDADSTNPDIRTNADELLQTFMPFLLRFFSDEYDEVCSTVIPALTDLITMFRRFAKAKGALLEQYKRLLQPILDAVITKMRYDETLSWGEEDDQTDEAEFQELRKRLYVLQQTIAAVDETLYIETVGKVVAHNLESVHQADWRDIDLALHEMYLFGELAVKNGGIYAKSVPSSVASQHLIRMMDKLVESDLASYPHPAIQLNYMEICVRYVQYFEHHPDAVSNSVANFIRLAHSTHVKVRLRAWYLLQRYTKFLRTKLSAAAQDIVQALGDLLVIKAEAPSDRDDGDVSSEDNDQSADAVFSSQLFLFEAVGCVASTTTVPLETKVQVAGAVIGPLSADIKRTLDLAKGGDTLAVLQIHHIIMAFGSLANGYSDWTPGQKNGGPPDSAVSMKFVEASEAVLDALAALSGSLEIRTAARHSFSRFMGVLGVHIFPQLPRWIEGLLSSASTNDEMAMFLRLLGQVVYGFNTEIFDILDQLLSPLLQKVFAGLSSPVGGTDDEIQLKELKQQYLNFLLVIMNHNLGSVLVSAANQGTFDALLNTVMVFAVDPTDPANARLAFSVLTLITSVWGGPDITTDQASAPQLAGFDGFLLSSLAPLPWRLISSSGFNAADAQMRSVLQEAAGLQWTVLRKCGARYSDQLRSELQGLGVRDEGTESYMKSISADLPGFKKFFAGFVQSAK